MSALPLALRLRFLWYRHCWRFHWAHYPACGPYKRETLRFGPMRVCKSCTCFYGGILAGLIAATVLAPPAGNWGWLAAGVLTVVLLVLNKPARYVRFQRRARSSIRLSTGMLLGWWSATAFDGQPLLGGGMLLLTFAVLWHCRTAWRALRLEHCEACPEMAQGGICSGYAPQAENIRRYEEDAARLAEERWLQSKGKVSGEVSESPRDRPISFFTLSPEIRAKYAISRKEK